MPLTFDNGMEPLPSVYHQYEINPEHAQSVSPAQPASSPHSSPVNLQHQHQHQHQHAHAAHSHSDAHAAHSESYAQLQEHEREHQNQHQHQHQQANGNGPRNTAAGSNKPAHHRVLALSPTKPTGKGKPPALSVGGGGYNDEATIESRYVLLAR